MEYSIPVVNEYGKNYFLACYEDMRFLFRRLNASTLIDSPQGEYRNKFEVRRNDGVVAAGKYYNLPKKRRTIPLFLVRYSEVSAYNAIRNYETFHADNFFVDDEIFSEVNVHDVKARCFASSVSWMYKLDAQMQSLRSDLPQRNIQMMITANESFIREVQNNQDALGLRTFIVPDYF